MTRRSITIAGCVVALTLAACASTPQPPPPSPEGQMPPATQLQLTGTVTYRERVALTPEAVVQVEVVEQRPDGGTGAVVGEQTLRNPGQVPISFAVAIPSERVRPEATYVVRARITDAGRVLTTPEPVPVLTQGNRSSDVQLLVRSGG
jgi:putative lipoprotein